MTWKTSALSFSLPLTLLYHFIDVRKYKLLVDGVITWAVHGGGLLLLAFQFLDETIKNDKGEHYNPYLCQVFLALTDEWAGREIFYSKSQRKPKIPRNQKHDEWGSE